MNSNSHDFDINITPIIDCFTVLITFLLVSASFISLGIFDTQLSQSGGQNSQLQKTLIISLRDKGIVLIKPEKAPVQVISPLENGEHDLEKITTTVKSLNLNNVLPIELQSEDSVNYDSFIKIYDSIQPLTTSLSIGGI